MKKAQVTPAFGFVLCVFEHPFRNINVAVLIAVAFVLFRYRTNEKVQKATVITLIGAFLIYTASIMFAELIR